MDAPLVSVGVPVFNEGRFIRESLESLVSQDHPNIELIISDNASTDNTGEVCKEYSQRYDWVHYHRHEKNNGPTHNFTYVLDSAKGKYFMWASGHDLWSKNYLSSCVEMLEKYQNAVIAFGMSIWIDESGENIERASGWTDTRGMDVVARYFTVLWGNMHPVLGLMRSEKLKSFPLIQTAGTDLILLTEMVLTGDFVHAVEADWSRREYRREYSYASKAKRYITKDYGLSSSFIGKIFPLARLPFALIKVIITADLSIAARILILLLLLPTLPVRYITGIHKQY